MEKYTKTELKKKIEEADKRIDDIDLQIDALREKRQEEMNERRKYANSLNKLEADEFRQNHGKDKPLEEIDSPYSLPKDIGNEWYELYKSIKCGCNGDPIDGCRGCSHNCHDIAKAKFEEKYNIKVHCL
jgi:chromosome segregation ATPase